MSSSNVRRGEKNISRILWKRVQFLFIFSFFEMPKELVSMRVGENFLKSIRRSEGKIIFNFFVTNFIENSRSTSEKAADIKICYDYRSKLVKNNEFSIVLQLRIVWSDLKKIYFVLKSIWYIREYEWDNTWILKNDNEEWNDNSRTSLFLFPPRW